ncbi:MAG: hypothetical protein M0P43_01885 [Arcobacteraceae bacterium]|nr:hypothetical protein [Arcobacteraceae bacterium]
MLQFLMINLKQITFGFIVLITIVLVYLFYNLNNIEKEKLVINNLENALLMAKNLLEEEKKQALSFAILLGGDKEFLDAFQKNDRKKAYEIIQTKLEQLSFVQPDKFRIQIHDKKLNTYIRSWNFELSGEPLESFRKGLVVAKNTKKPIASIELGKRLNIKAIVPILDNKEFIGSIEVITEFETLSFILQQRGYELFVLLDDEFLSIATDLVTNKKIKNFVVCNVVDNLTLLNSLENVDIDNLGEYGYVVNNHISFGYFSIYDLDNVHLGYIITATNSNLPINLEKKGIK